MIPTNQPQGLPRAPHADLLMATLPYESLANSVCGYASRYLGFSKKKIAVLAAWLAYLQEHSNRVWPSEETLANLAAVSISTVRRVKAILRATLKIQPVDADKLHSGPGPHDYQGEKRSRREVDTYDLSPLLGVLPPPMVDLLLAPPHAQKPKPDAPQPPAQNIQPNDTHPALVDATGFPDPLSDPAPAVSISATAENPNPSEVPASHARSVASHSVCSVSIEREGQADSEGPNVPAVKKEKKPLAATATKTVLVSEKTRIVEGGAGPGFLALRQLGVWEKVCYDIVAERGDPFAYKLACYARWANTVAADGNRAGFARRTWKGFEGWPDRFEQWFDRQEKLANQQAHLEANARAAKPKAAPPPVASSEPIPPDVLDRAFAEIVQKARPERRKITIDRGKNAPDVEARARLMMKQKPEGTA